jgi:hypothetical protein
MPWLFYSWGKALSIHWTGGWVSPRAGLDSVEKRKFLTLKGLELQSFGHPAHSQLLLTALPHFNLPIVPFNALYIEHSKF